MRYSSSKSLNLKIEDLIAKNRRATKAQKKRETQYRASLIRQRQEKINFYRDFKKAVKQIEKAQRKSTKEKYYKKYVDIKKTFTEEKKKKKIDFANIVAMLQRRTRLDNFYKNNIEERGVQFLKGLDYYLRARNVDISDILLKYDLKALSDAIYSNTNHTKDIREFFGYDEAGNMIEDETTAILETIAKSVEDDDAEIIRNIIKNYEESQIMEGFTPL